MKRYPVHLIAKPSGSDVVFFEDGDTDDIINSIVQKADKKTGTYTKKFASCLKGKTVLETCGNIHQFIKDYIPYELDPNGKQQLKLPGRLFVEQAGDCKSFSLFTASLLQNLKIPYGYRFTSYKADDPTPTHVYIYVPQKNGEEIIIDAVWKGPFNTQKKYAHKRDIMPQIVMLGATETPATALMPRGAIGELRISKDLDELTDGELSLLLAKQKLEIDQHNAVRIGGTFKNAGYNRSIALVDHMLNNVHRPELIVSIGEQFEQHPDAHIAGLGKFIKKVGKSIASGAKAVGKGVVTAAKATGKAVATGAKVVAKTAVKVATFVPKLIAKGIMEIYLPKAAPMFLYLFAAPGVNLPDKMRRKKEKSEKFKRFVCGKLEMKEAHFMSIIRNALTKKYGTSPESYLATQLKAQGIAGIMQQRRIGETPMTAFAPTSIPQSVANRVNSLPQGKKSGGGLTNVLNSALQGNFIGAAMGAISWIISKLGGSKEDALTADDAPDPVNDAANSVSFTSNSSGGSQSSSGEDYSNVSSGRNMVDVKNAVADLIDAQASDEQIRATLDQFGYLSQSQKEDLFNEVKAGYTPLEPKQSIDLANEIKRNANNDPYSNGGGTGSYCKC